MSKIIPVRQKLFLDTNILLDLADKKNPDFNLKFFKMVKSKFSDTNQFWISDLVFNETHANLTNKGVEGAYTYMNSIITGQKGKVPFCKISNHNQSNREEAFELTRMQYCIVEKKGLSMVDALLLLQMNDEDGLIFTKDKRMSYYSNTKRATVAYWVDF
jgi:predicted nucleic acid-binding protein